MTTGPWFSLCLSLVACAPRVEAPRFTEIASWNERAALGGLDLSADGQAVILGSAGGESSLWTAPWKLSVPFDRVEGTLLASSFTREGYVLLLRAPGLVELRSSSGAAIQEIRLPLPSPAARAAASPNGAYVAFDGRLYALDGQKLLLEGASGFAFAGDRFVASMRAAEPEVSVYELERAERREFRAPGSVTAVALSEDARHIAAGTSGAVVVWRNDDRAPVCERSSGEVAALSFSRSGRWLAFVSGESLRVLDAQTCRERAVVQLDAAATALDLDGDLAAVGDARGNVYVWDLFNQRLVGRGGVVAGAVTQLRVHAGMRGVLAGHGGEARLVGLR
jgi:WD40 repeat protein